MLHCNFKPQQIMGSNSRFNWTVRPSEFLWMAKVNGVSFKNSHVFLQIEFKYQYNTFFDFDMMAYVT